MDEISSPAEYQPHTTVKILSSKQNPGDNPHHPTFNTIFDNPQYNIPAAWFRVPEGVQLNVVEDKWEENGQEIVVKTGTGKAKISRVEEKYLDDRQTEEINGYTIYGGGKILHIFLEEDGGKTPIILDSHTRHSIKQKLIERQQHIYNGIPVQFEPGDEIEFDVDMDTGYMSILPPLKRMRITLDRYNQTTQELKAKKV